MWYTSGRDEQLPRKSWNRGSSGDKWMLSYVRHGLQLLCTDKWIEVGRQTRPEGVKHNLL